MVLNIYCFLVKDFDIFYNAGDGVDFWGWNKEIGIELRGLCWGRSF
jgi:hypothetical protein